MLLLFIPSHPKRSLKKYVYLVSIHWSKKSKRSKPDKELKEENKHEPHPTWTYEPVDTAFSTIGIWIQTFLLTMIALNNRALPGFPDIGSSPCVCTFVRGNFFYSRTQKNGMFGHLSSWVFQGFIYQRSNRKELDTCSRASKINFPADQSL